MRKLALRTTAFLAVLTGAHFGTDNGAHAGPSFPRPPSPAQKAQEPVELPAAILQVRGSPELAAKEFNVQFCKPEGMGFESATLNPEQERYYATLCAAYYVAAYELTGATNALDTAKKYADRYKLTVQDIDPETYPDPKTSTWVADMKKIGADLAGLTQAERQRRGDMWAGIASGFFTQTHQSGQNVRPSNLIRLARELKAQLKP